MMAPAPASRMSTVLRAAFAVAFYLSPALGLRRPRSSSTRRFLAGIIEKVPAVPFQQEHKYKGRSSDSGCGPSIPRPGDSR